MTTKRWRVQIFTGSSGAQFQHEFDDDLAGSIHRGSTAAEVRAVLEEYADEWSTIDYWLGEDDDFLESLGGRIEENEIRMPGAEELESDLLALDLPGIDYVDAHSLSPASGLPWVVVEEGDTLDEVIRRLSDKYEFIL